MPHKKFVPTWLDDEVWLELLEPMMMDDPTRADRAARLWSYLLSEIDSGPEGVVRARQCLENALRVTFPFSQTCRKCRSEYERAIKASVLLRQRRRH